MIFGWLQSIGCNFKVILLSEIDMVAKFVLKKFIPSIPQDETEWFQDNFVL